MCIYGLFQNLWLLHLFRLWIYFSCVYYLCYNKTCVQCCKICAELIIFLESDKKTNWPSTIAILFKKLFVLCFSRLILTRSAQISGQNNSDAREPEGVVKITYGIVASSLFKRAGNSNKEFFLNCGPYENLSSDVCERKKKHFD